jgi:hypothetical protein
VRNGLRSFAVCLAAFVVTANAASDETLLQNLDFNRDGSLSADVEIKAGIKHRVYPKKVDLAALRKKGAAVKSEDVGEIDTAVAVSLWEFQRDFSPKAHYKIGELHRGKRITADYFGLTQPVDDTIKDTTSYWIPSQKTVEERLKIRRSAEHLSLPVDRAEGAIFSYSHDFNKGTDQWAAHGIVAYDMAWETNPKLGFTEGSKSWEGQRLTKNTRFIRPSIAFDKVDTGGGDQDEEDSLVFRLGFGGFQTLPGAGGKSWIQSIRGEINAKYQTDFDREHGVLGGEVNIIPFSEPLRLNSSFSSLGPFLYTVQVVLHAEGGTVIDAGDRPALREFQDFFRAGALVGVQLVPKAFREDISLGASYKYYPTLVGDKYDIELLSAFLEARVFGSKHLSLKFNYDRGRTADRSERSHVFTTGLGIRY